MQGEQHTTLWRAFLCIKFPPLNTFEVGRASLCGLRIDVFENLCHWLARIRYLLEEKLEHEQLLERCLELNHAHLDVNHFKPFLAETLLSEYYIGRIEKHQALILLRYFIKRRALRVCKDHEVLDLCIQSTIRSVAPVLRVITGAIVCKNILVILLLDWLYV